MAISASGGASGGFFWSFLEILLRCHLELSASRISETSNQTINTMDASTKSQETGFILFARISPDDVVLYANSALASYLGWSKERLVGATLEQIADALNGEMAEFFSRQAVTGSFNRYLADEAGRIFEASQVSDGVVLDLMLTEVTQADQLLEPFRASIALNQSELTEEEIRGVLQPERRILTLSRSRLVGLADLVASLPPTELRLLLETFTEEMRESILENGSSVGDLRVDEIEALHGVPRYYQDHALRALRCVFAQQERMQMVRGALHRVGKEIPAISSAIVGGEVLLNPLALPGRSRLTASGAVAEFCQRLVRLARPGEILISQFALTAILSHLPEGWAFLRAESEDIPDLSDLAWHGEEVLPLTKELERKVYLVGPQIEDHPEQCEFFFDYLFSLRMPGFDTPVPILRAVRPENRGNIALSDEKLVVTQAAQVLGKYKLLEIVGSGGMGKVWRAQDRFGNTVAIKVLNSHEAANEDTVRRFQREANVMARLPHRNICRVFEIGSYEGILFIAMEFVNGPTLADLLYQGLQDGSIPATPKGQLPDLIKSLQMSRHDAVRRGEQPVAETAARPLTNRILPIAQTVSLFLKICEGVQFAHEQGILHRDLKPGNVLLRADGEPVVADFGLAKLEEESEVSLSVSGHIVGTIENMSPEQAESSKDVDERADVYSLGTILYQMLTGHRHFQASGNLFQDAQRLAHHTPERPRQLNPQVDADLEIICLKALRPNPAERYRTVSALVADLQRYRRGEIIKARPVTALELARKLVARNKAVSTTVAVALLFLSGLATFSFWQMNNRRLAAEQALSHRSRADDAVRREMAMRKEYEMQIAGLEEKVRQLTSGESASSPASREAVDSSSASTALAESPAEIPPSSALSDAGAASGVSPEDQREAQFALGRARSIFYESFLLENLLRPEEADTHAALVLEGMDNASLALALGGSNPEAHLLKGFFHLALGEYAEANADWEVAAQADESAFPGATQARQLREYAQETFSESGENRRAFLNLLAQSEMFDFVKIAYLAEQISPVLVSGRLTTPGESRLQAKLNPTPEQKEADISEKEAHTENAPPSLASLPEEKVEEKESIPGPRIVRDPRGGRTLEIRDLTNLPTTEELLKMAGGPILRLRLIEVGGSVNWDPLWDQLAEYGVQYLEVINSNAEFFPEGPLPLFQPLRELIIRETPVTHLAFLRQSNQLRSLEITGTQIQELSPVTMCPLEVLIIDKKLAHEGQKTRLLGFHRTLRELRTPEEPVGQSVEQFFQKQARGDYGSAGGR